MKRRDKVEFEEACSEMSFIIEHMEPSVSQKIPAKLKDFFKSNKSIFYKVNLTTEKSLFEQELKDETKAFIEIIKEKYLSKDMIDEEVQTIESQEKEFERTNDFQKKDEMNLSTEIIIYKENRIVNFFRRIINFFRCGL